MKRQQLIIIVSLFIVFNCNAQVVRDLRKEINAEIIKYELFLKLRLCQKGIKESSHKKMKLKRDINLLRKIEELYQISGDAEKIDYLLATLQQIKSLENLLIKYDIYKIEGGRYYAEITTGKFENKLILLETDLYLKSGEGRLLCTSYTGVEVEEDFIDPFYLRKLLLHTYIRYKINGEYMYLSHKEYKEETISNMKNEYSNLFFNEMDNKEDENKEMYSWETVDLYSINGDGFIFNQIKKYIKSDQYEKLIRLLYSPNYISSLYSMEVLKLYMERNELKLEDKELKRIKELENNTVLITCIRGDVIYTNTEYQKIKSKHDWKSKYKELFD